VQLGLKTTGAAGEKGITMSNVFDQSGEKSVFIVARYRAEFNDAEYDQRNAMLDEIAHAASDGSGRALELLLELLDVHQLASPIVRRLIIDEGMAEEAEQDVLVAVVSSCRTRRCSFIGRAIASTL